MIMGRWTILINELLRHQEHDCSSDVELPYLALPYPEIETALQGAHVCNQISSLVRKKIT